VDVEAVKALKVSGKGPAEIAKELGIGRVSVYRALAVWAVTFHTVVPCPAFLQNCVCRHVLVEGLFRCHMLEHIGAVGARL
jgi:hypothetical protein